ncbi:hypothetical protein [Catenulispora acidiphila]|uniref:hypothetical protein n=1 Tax=Catenulispora acidiphila TaxID=304895 RepID=UPI0006764063|nr:hypothetical protein [Catenulispora acidiphila]
MAALKPLLKVLRDERDAVLVDLGEIDPRESSTADLLGSLASLLVVARAVPEQAARVAAAASDLRLTNRNVRVLFIGDLREGDAETVAGLPTAGVLPLINPNASLFSRLADRRSRRAFGGTTVRVAEELAWTTVSREREVVTASASDGPEAVR